MSDRFCRAFPGLSRRIDGDRTLLESDGPGAAPLRDVLATLGNLGLEILAVENGATSHTTLEA